VSATKPPLSVLPGTFAVSRLPADSPVPAWALDQAFVSVTRTSDELSIVCAEEQVPMDITAERGWRALKVEGPLDFGLTGILAGLAAPLAAAGISIFAISTYDTDYLLVREERLEEAIDVLAGAGYRFRAYSNIQKY
jgi:hypothetical protein